MPLKTLGPIGPRAVGERVKLLLLVGFSKPEVGLGNTTVDLVESSPCKA